MPTLQVVDINNSVSGTRVCVFGWLKGAKEMTINSRTFRRHERQEMKVPGMACKLAQFSVANGTSSLYLSH